MNILMISSEGDGFSLALALQLTGDFVKVYTTGRNRDLEYSMSGILDRIDSLDQGLRWANLVLCDMVGQSSLQSKVRKSGNPYIGLNKFADMLELDRAKQMELFRRVGIQIPPTYEFPDPYEALSVLSFWDDPGYCIKPSGNLATAKTVLAETEQTYKWALQQYAADQPLIVQKIVNGVEISTEGFFNGTEWSCFTHTFEEKRFLNGGLGQNTGCMGNVVVYGDPDTRLSQEVKKLEAFLKKAKYRGPIDLNCIVNESGVYALEATPRFGYDAIETLWAMSDRYQFSTFLMEIASGKESEFPLEHQYGCAVRLSLPPYPFGDPDEEHRFVPIEAPSTDSILWSDVYTNNGMIYSAGFDNVIAKVVGVGSYPEESINDCYETVAKVKALNLQYRTDIGQRVPDALTSLETMNAGL